MKVPKTFVPEKGLEKNIERMLKSKKKLNLDKPVTDITQLEIESNYSPYQFTFDGSLKRLKDNHYKRHLSPWEYFELLTRYYDGTLPEELQFSIEQMREDYGEWFSMAFEKRDDKLICYIDPENLTYDKAKGIYVINKKFRYNYRKEFKIKNIPSKKWVHVTKFSDEFIEYFYNRQLEDMPEYVTVTRNQFLIYLPPEDGVFPISRAYGRHSQFSMGCFNILSQSRGAREKNFVKYLCPDKL
jgi:hypothetical protein